MIALQHNMPVSIVVAVDTLGGFGKDGKLPWNVPEDLKHFNQLTKGHICIMGRRTYQDMLEMWQERQAKRKNAVATEPKQILTDRESFVVTSDPDFHCPGATRVKSITEAIQSLNHDETREIFVIGGYRMFVEALGRAKAVHMTVIKGDPYDCDRKFPIHVLNKYFKITNGTQSDQCYYVTYTPKREDEITRTPPINPKWHLRGRAV